MSNSEKKNNSKTSTFERQLVKLKDKYPVEELILNSDFSKKNTK
jgi:hypothetical protein